MKLQTYTPDTMTIDSTMEDFKIRGGLWDGYTLWDLYKWAHTPFEWQKELFEFARENEITCISTPFDETAVDLLEEIGTPFYKVASFELTDLPLIKYIASKNKPVILSTGMANEVEIDEAVEVVKKYGCGDFVLLHCVSGYPTPIDQINLDTINLLRQKFRTEIGLSDHTLGNVSAIMSIAYGVKVIEKHFTLKRDDGGPDAGFSMEPEELLTLSRDVRDAHDAIGEGSFARKDAEKSNAKFRRSLYIVEDIKKGEIFTKKNLRKIRPGYGLPPKLFDEIIGKKTNQDIKRGTALSLDMVD